MKTLDDFITIKRKDDSDKKEEKEKNEILKKSFKKMEKIEKESIEPKISENFGNLKFYSDYNSFINKLSTWKEPLKSFINPPKNTEMENIYKFIKKEYATKKIFPPYEQIFFAFEKTTWDNLKVVIIGQDPYPNDGDAMGLSFSVPKTQKIPASLRNIYKALEKEFPEKFKKPIHGDLTKWAAQGVFLLNATLTVEAHKANSHQKNSGWTKFTDYVIKIINTNKKNIVFLLWGNFAINKKKLIDVNKHCIITNIHPSPLAQSKERDFSNSTQFAQANNYLQKNGISPIDWCIE